MFLADTIETEFSKFIIAFCNNFNIDLEKGVNYANSYSSDHPTTINTSSSSVVVSVKSLSETAPSVKTSLISQTSSVGEDCGYIVRPRGNKPPHACGKKARNMVDGVWYCGNQREDGTGTGHLGSALKTTKKKMVPSASTIKNAVTQELVESVSDKTKTVKEKAKPASPPPVIKLVEKKNTINVSKVADSNFYIEKDTRIVIDPDSKKATGVLDDDNKTVNSLTDSDKRFLEAHNIEIDEIEGNIDTESEGGVEEEVVEYETEGSYEEVEVTEEED